MAVEQLEQPKTSQPQGLDQTLLVEDLTPPSHAKLSLALALVNLRSAIDMARSYAELDRRFNDLNKNPEKHKVELKRLTDDQIELEHLIEEDSECRIGIMSTHLITLWEGGYVRQHAIYDTERFKLEEITAMVSTTIRGCYIPLEGLPLIRTHQSGVFECIVVDDKTSLKFIANLCHDGRERVVNAFLTRERSGIYGQTYYDPRFGYLALVSGNLRTNYNIIDMFGFSPATCDKTIEEIILSRELSTLDSTFQPQFNQN